MAAQTARGGRQGQTRPQMGGMGFLNPERVHALAPKYANKIGKTIERVSIHYAEEGVTVEVDSLIDSSGEKIAESETVSLAEFHRRLGEANAPSDDERLRSLRRKYELRLNMEFPREGPASGSEADIQSWLDRLPFAQRRALLMSQKAFDKAYPDGFRA
jgi:hypothetical protein